MKKLFISFITIILAATLFISCGSKAITDDYGCFVSYDDAVDNAKKKKQPLLVFFTSEGDDEQSTQIISAIFKDSAFASDILKNYSVYHADFSEKAFSKSNAPENATKEQQELANTYTYVIQNNYQYAMLFGVDAMPAIFLCTKEGFVVDRLPDDEKILNLQGLKNALDSYSEDLASFDAMVAETSKGSAIKKVEAIDTLYRATADEYQLFLYPLVKTAVELDKNNESGLCGKFVVAAAEAEALSAYSQGDVETAVSQYLKAADNKFVRAEDKQECFYTAAYLVAYNGSEDYEGIITYLQTAYDLAPDSAKAPAIKDAITYFNTVLESVKTQAETN